MEMIMYYDLFTFKWESCCLDFFHMRNHNVFQHFLFRFKSFCLTCQLVNVDI